MDQSKSSSFRQSFQTDQVVDIKDFGVTMPESLEKNKQEKHNMGMNVVTFGKASGRTMSQTQLPDKKLRVQKITQHDWHVKSTNVFKGKTFCFSNLFPEEQVRYMELE
jgi:topoisomerase (DNA) II binding protein 1